MEFNINYLAVLACGVASMVIGFVWYSKALFAGAWMKLAGVSEKQVKEANSNMAKLYGTMFVASLLMAYVLSHFVQVGGAADLVTGATVGFWAWLGFVATTMLTNVLYEGRPVKLYLINAGYQLVTLVTMGAILATWV